MKYTESEIKKEGSRRFFKKNKKRILLLSLASIAWIPIAIFFVSGNSVFAEYPAIVKFFIYLSAPILVTTNVLFSRSISCKLFLERIKREPDLMK